MYDMPGNISPEERLFKIIKDEKTSSPKEDGNAKKSRLGAAHFEVRRFFSNLKFARPPRDPGARALFASMPVSFSDIDLRAINAGLAFILALMITLVVYYGVIKRPSVNNITSARFEMPAAGLKARKAEGLKSITFYLDHVNKRNIFKPAPPSEARAPEAAAPPAQSAQKLKDAVAGIKIKGIAMGRIPRVVIEDEKSKKTYFLKEGQLMGLTGVEIKTILKNKVIIRIGGEEMELT